MTGLEFILIKTYPWCWGEAPGFLVSKVAGMVIKPPMLPTISLEGLWSLLDLLFTVLPTEVVS